MLLAKLHEFVVEFLLRPLPWVSSSIGRSQGLGTLFAEALEQMADGTHGQVQCLGNLGG
jgi:hypothetical protein